MPPPTSTTGRAPLRRAAEWVLLTQVTGSLAYADERRLIHEVPTLLTTTA
ncbi:hypothetical protein ThrDRAFT_00149 [Frankia casuarinae]|jgi:hypothetical protein|nr:MULTISPECIES: hypothetical protein [Frankia]ETA03962.1 hypothetical protein CcI6DRAFT_00485 [Frankia sp. CcI6]EYT94223.1 hypothetical protein ThrDRAFT_00149 [Frankia casuarinae]KDA42582.1 hypothetical protein BMG523Draft_02559 [Frankia sp. BMG5.23]KEZ36215.1 hypothetical protein CEDDRAFT_02394 [Frankia sp. CeD]KFB06860.1 hypothetical protein ALLO2DRAFT_00147 [Frankia sp. Allo2]